jgi:hypothetical protein
MGDFYKGQYGEIELDTEQDCSLAISLKIEIKKPDNITTVIQEATLNQDNKTIKSTFLLDVAGIYQRRAIVQFSPTNTASGVPTDFIVKDSWEK